MAEGLSRADAIRAQRTVTRFVLGTSLLERAASGAPSPIVDRELAALSTDRPLLGDLMRTLGTSADEGLFEFGLEALLTGIGSTIAGAGEG